MMRSSARRRTLAAVIGGLVALGWMTVAPPTSGAVELVRCDSADPLYPGFATATQAADAPDDAPICDDTGSQEVVSASGPALRTSEQAAADDHYRHNGQQTTNQHSGGKITVEVTNPSVTHTSGAPAEFVVSRVMGKTGGSDVRWLEVGWAENNFGGGGSQVVYTYSTTDDRWHYHTGYNISAGHFYSFRVRGCTVGGAAQTCADIYWNGQWRLVRHTSHGCSDNTCYIEAYTEIYSANNTFPALAQDGTGVSWKNNKIRTASGWTTWSGSIATSRGWKSPYRACWPSSSNAAFTVVKASTC